MFENDFKLLKKNFFCTFLTQGGRGGSTTRFLGKNQSLIFIFLRLHVLHMSYYNYFLLRSNMEMQSNIKRYSHYIKCLGWSEDSS